MALAALLAAVGAGAVSAHPGGPEEIIVVGDHVDPGQTFQLLAAFIEPGVDVPITVVTGSTVFDLGSASVDAAGRFDVSLTLPSDVPHGYAELHIDQPNEGDAATVFLVGPRDAHDARRAARPGRIRVRQPGGRAHPVRRDAGRDRRRRLPADPRWPQADDVARALAELSTVPGIGTEIYMPL